MISAFVKGFGQLSDPRARHVIWISIAAAVTVFIALWTTIGFALTSTALFSIGWLETVIDLLGGLATGVLTWVLFPAVISGVMGFMLDSIATTVEKRHYPDLGPARKVALSEQVWTTLRFVTILIFLNLFLLLFLFIPPLFPFVFYTVNGYLLSREYFELVAMRRVGPTEIRAMRKSRKGTLFLAGVAIAFMLTVPLVNLLAPVVATAVMVHLFEGWRSGA